MSRNKESRTTDIHKIIVTQLKAIPKQLFKTKITALIDQKVPNAPHGLALAFADHIIARVEKPFEFNSADERDITIEFTPAEIQNIEREIHSFVKTEVPSIITKIIDDSAQIILKSLKGDWRAQRDWQLATGGGFRERLEERWGAAFDILRMMYTISHEIGAIVEQRRRRSRAKRNLVLQDTIRHLHVRACQVVAEILCLMENGFADGAMARWRTLHEITIVAAVIAHFGEDLAVRYRAHEAVEAKRAMDRYQASHSTLGLAPLSKKEIAEVESAYAQALVLYGDRFGSEYGWAGFHLGLKKPRFIDLEQAAGKIEMRAYYGMASYNVHASPKGIAFRLGLLRELGSPTGLAGASNIGFVDPAQLSAFDITFVTGLILRSGNIDDMIQLKILILLRDNIMSKLERANRRIMREHRSLLKNKSV
ncbi:DUF5677 domain-containing protein [Sphingomonas panacis]|uniref:DUF5677 domain-containing protein n=1 Tax=Sphingomonas panacis TaxID=1560345 RepID=UPI000A927772|nr:DUF5677 domain-containing protein [Sphingomonas panacis]